MPFGTSKEATPFATSGHAWFFRCVANFSMHNTTGGAEGSAGIAKGNDLDSFQVITERGVQLVDFPYIAFKHTRSGHRTNQTVITLPSP